MKRFFAYGCSFTKWQYPTWADCIGVNFDEYYNHGRGGCDHTYILDTVHEDNLKYKFNKDTDVIFVATTGVNRLTWYDHRSAWPTGDLYNWQNSIKQAGLQDWSKFEGFFNELWNLDWACLRTSNAVIQIKSFLNFINVDHKIFQGMNSKFILEKELSLGSNTLEKFRTHFQFIEDIPAIDDYRCENECHSVNDDHGLDGHPGQPRHFSYVKKFFPKYYTDESEKFYNKTVNEFFFKSYPKSDTRNKEYHCFLKNNYPNFKWLI